MATLGGYYCLCSLIDYKLLLGVTEDCSEENAIVTLNQNIAINYKLSTQKPLNSWKTTEKFSSSVYYDDEQQKYLAVFNHKFIRLWSKNQDEDLDKLKKISFKEKIFNLVKIHKKIFVVFQNGGVFPLQDALKNKGLVFREDNIEGIQEVISCYFDGGYYVGLLTETALFWCNFHEENSWNCSLKKINLIRDNCKLIGTLFYAQDGVKFLTLWNDGKLFTSTLEENSSLGELYTTIETISTKQPVFMQQLNENHIAFYGANLNQEGGSLEIFYTPFKICESQQPLKLYLNKINLFKISNNLIFPVGDNLAVFPITIKTEKLSDLIGSQTHFLTDEDVSEVTEVEFGVWNKKFSKKINFDKYTSKISAFVKRGFSETLILDQILKETIKNNEEHLLEAYLIHFKDITEENLCLILQHMLRHRNSWLNLVLAKPFCEVHILEPLKKLINLEGVVVLLNYLCLLLEDEEALLPGLDEVESDNRIIRWGRVIIDCNYQQIVLSRDHSLEEVVKKFALLVQANLDFLEDLELCEPVLSKFIKGQKVKKLAPTSLLYVIEQKRFY